MKHKKAAGLLIFLVIAAISAYIISYRANYRSRVIELFSNDNNLNTKDIEIILKDFLPEGSELLDRKDSNRVKNILQGDMDGDGVNELVALYQRKNSTKNGLFIVTYKNKEWKKIYNNSKLGRVIDWTGFEDMTGDGCHELLVGSGTGASLGFGLEVLKWQGDMVVNIGGLAYHMLQVEDMPGEEGKDGIAEVAAGQKDGTFDVFRLWNFGQFIPAEDVYKYFFTREISRLERPDSDSKSNYDNYLLARAQFFAARYEDCLHTLTGIPDSFNNDDAAADRLILLKARATAAQGDYKSSEQLISQLLEDEEALKDRSDFQIECLLSLGRIYNAAGNYEAARKAYNDCYDLTGRIYEKNEFLKLALQLPVREAASRLETEKAYEELKKQFLKAESPQLDALRKITEAWGASENVEVDFITPERSEGKGDFALVSIDKALSGKETPGNIKGYIILSIMDDVPASQLFYTGNRERYINRVASFRVVSGKDGNPEAGIVFNSSNGNYINPVYSLLCYKEGSWKKVWSSPEKGWRNNDGSITFIGEGISELVIKSCSFCIRDSRSELFTESHAGPHRWFMDTWIRQGNTYVLKSAELIPSAYATMVEFVYYLAKGEDKRASNFIAEDSLIKRAKDLGLIQKPFGQGWMVETGINHSDLEGPLIVVKNNQGVDIIHKIEISFVNRNGQYFISAILPLKAGN